MAIETHIPLLEEILSPWKIKIGNDYDGYKNHVYRMLNFCFYLAKPNEEEKTKLIITAAFHDIGIWSDNTLDYLPPSVTQALVYLNKHELSSWTKEITLIIDMHHKLRPYKNTKLSLVEWFRKADLIDFSLGRVRYGVPKKYIQEVKGVFPNAGFHKRLIQLSWKQLKDKPFNPAPMFKW